MSKGGTGSVSATLNVPLVLPFQYPFSVSSCVNEMKKETKLHALCTEHGGRTPSSFLLYIIFECALKAFFLTLWITCISCKYSFIDFINFFRSCFVSLCQTNKHHAPFFLSFLLDFCESWSLAEEEEQSSKNPCSHHEATSAWSFHRVINCWVSCVRSADAAKWMAMEESLFFVVFFFFLHQRQICRDCRGREGVKKQKLQTVILSDNWNVGLMFGDNYTSVQRDTHFPVQSGCYCRSMSQCSWNSWLASIFPYCCSPELGFCDVSRWICFCFYDVEFIIWVPCLVYNSSQVLSEADKVN